MSSYDELIGILKHLLLDRFVPKPSFIKGVLGDGVGNVEVPNRKDFSYARFNRGSTEFFEIFNKNAPNVDGWPVLIGEFFHQPGLTQVVGTDWEAYYQSGWGNDVSTTNLHAPTHVWRDQWIGSDPLEIYMRSIAPARGYSLTGTTVYVNAFEYFTGTIWPGLPGVDLSPAIGALSTGSARFMGVYVNFDNTLGIVTGSTSVDTLAFDPPLVQFPWATIPIARVRTYGGQSSVKEADFRDARQLFGTSVKASQAEVDAAIIDTKYVTPATLPGAAPLFVKSRKNLLTHSLTFNLWQEGVTFNDPADDTYVADLWNNVHNGNAPDITRQAGGSSDPFSHYLRITFDTASSQAGIVQFLEAVDTYPLRGETVSLSLDAWGTNVSNIRAAVLQWTGTADTITSDVVGTWAVGNPTLATNWAYASTPSASTAITTTRARYTFENITISTTANNLAVFIWTPDSEGSGDLVNIARVQLERGNKATEFVARSYAEELFRVQRYYEKSYEVGTIPGTNTAAGATQFQTRQAIAASTAGLLRESAIFKVMKRTAPTVTVYAVDGTINAVTNATAVNVRTGVTASSPSEGSCLQWVVDNTDADAIALDDIMRFQWTANARL